MSDNKPQQSRSKDDSEIYAVIERWAEAVREANLEPFVWITTTLTPCMNTMHEHHSLPAE